MELNTERLYLRDFRRSDAKTVQHLAAEYDIARTTLNIPHPYPDGAAEQWIEAITKGMAKGSIYALAVIRKSDNELMGAMSMRVQAEHNRAELAYWLGRPYWGNGYTSEAAAAMVDFGFTKLHLHRVYAAAMTKNPGSIGVMKKIGMKYEGRLVDHVKKWGEFQDLSLYGMTDTDYFQSTDDSSAT